MFGGDVETAFWWSLMEAPWMGVTPPPTLGPQRTRHIDSPVLSHPGGLPGPSLGQLPSTTIIIDSHAPTKTRTFCRAVKRRWNSSQSSFVCVSALPAHRPSHLLWNVSDICPLCLYKLPGGVGNSASGLLTTPLSQLEVRAGWKGGKPQLSGGLFSKAFSPFQPQSFQYFPGKVMQWIFSHFLYQTRKGDLRATLKCGVLLFCSQPLGPQHIWEKKSLLDNWLHNHNTALISSGCLT